MNNTKSIELINKYRGQIMGISALWIVVYHTWYRMFAPETSPKLLYYMELAVTKLGYFGVDIFFLLSGIGLSYSIVKHSTKQFLLRRFRRLAYPVLIAAAVKAIMEGWSFPEYLFRASGIGLFIGKDFFLWFISAITATYLLFPLYWRFFSRSRSKLRFTALFIIAWYLGSVLLDGVIPSKVALLLMPRVQPFVLGVFFGWAQQNGGLKMNRRVFNIAAVLSAAAGTALGWLNTIHSVGFFRLRPNGFIPGILVAFGFTVLQAELSGLLDRAGRATRGVNGFFGFYGRISLEIYCVQEFLGPIAADAARALGCGSLAVNLVQLAAVTLSAWLLHILTDRVLALTGSLRSRAKCAG